MVVKNWYYNDSGIETSTFIGAIYYFDYLLSRCWSSTYAAFLKFCIMYFITNAWLRLMVKSNPSTLTKTLRRFRNSEALFWLSAARRTIFLICCGWTFMQVAWFAMNTWKVNKQETYRQVTRTHSNKVSHNILIAKLVSEIWASLPWEDLPLSMSFIEMKCGRTSRSFGHMLMVLSKSCAEVLLIKTMKHQ